MNTQPKALQLADEFEDDAWISHTSQWSEEAVAELRRLHQSEREGWRYADELEQERKRLHVLTQKLVEALKWIADQMYDPWTNGAEAQRHAQAALAKATGEQV